MLSSVDHISALHKVRELKKKGFVKVAISRAVPLQECPLGELLLYLWDADNCFISLKGCWSSGHSQFNGRCCHCRNFPSSTVAVVEAQCAT